MVVGSLSHLYSAPLLVRELRSYEIVDVTEVELPAQLPPVTGATAHLIALMKELPEAEITPDVLLDPLTIRATVAKPMMASNTPVSAGVISFMKSHSELQSC
jgi:hypothetical protein